MTPEEAEGLWAMADGPPFLEHLRSLAVPVRTAHLTGYAHSIGLAGFSPLADAGAFMWAPIRHRGQGLGAICLAKKEPDPEFSREDEETLVTFASQAARVIANARRYREEQHARSDLEALVNTAPIGVAVFDARSGDLESVNREAQRIVSTLQEPGQHAADLLQVMSVRRADGTEFSLAGVHRGGGAHPGGDGPGRGDRDARARRQVGHRPDERDAHPLPPRANSCRSWSPCRTSRRSRSSIGCGRSSWAWSATSCRYR